VGEKQYTQQYKNIEHKIESKTLYMEEYYDCHVMC